MSDPWQALCAVEVSPAGDVYGGKVRCLRELVAIDSPVPPAWVLSTQTMRAALGTAAQLPVDALLAEEGSPRVAVERLLEDAAARVPRPARGGPWIVRSSSPWESREGHSAAGLYLSIAAADDLAGFRTAIARVWKSALAPEALMYHQLRWRPPATLGDHALAVICQQRILGRGGTCRVDTRSQRACVEWQDEDVWHQTLVAMTPTGPAVRPGLTPQDRERVRCVAALVWEAHRRLGSAHARDFEWAQDERDRQVWLVQHRLRPARSSDSWANLDPGCFTFSRAAPAVEWRLDVTHNPEPLSTVQADLVRRVADRCQVAPPRVVVGDYLYAGHIEDATRHPRPGKLPVVAPAPAPAATTATALERALGALAEHMLARVGCLHDQLTRPAAVTGPVIAKAVAAYVDIAVCYADQWTPLLRQARCQLRATLTDLGVSNAAEHARDLLLLAAPHPLERLVADSSAAALLRAELPIVWDVAWPGSPVMPRAAVPAMPRAAASCPGEVPASVLAPAKDSDRRRLHAAWWLSAYAHQLGEWDDLVYARAQSLLRHALLRWERVLELPPRDVFFVPLAELLQWQATDDRVALRARVCSERARIAQARCQRMPLTFAAGQPRDDSTAARTLWRGQGFGGAVQGPARRLDERLREQDCEAIVVAHDLSATMALHLRGARGIVLEAAHTLGHGAVIAHELGIPLVAGCRGICAAIEPGDTLWIDGARGVVLRGPASAAT